MAFRNYFMLICSLAAAERLSAQPAHAQTYVNEVAGWDIFRGDDYCAASMEYDGPGSTNLIAIKPMDDGFILMVSNGNWSPTKDKKYKISYELNGSRYSGESVAIDKGFGVKFDNDFDIDFRKGGGLDIYLEDKVVDELSLSGSSAAMAAVDRCLVPIRAQIAAEKREQERWSHIPKDPFAAEAEPAKVRKVPEPIGDSSSWASNNDYPAIALRNNESGKTEYTVVVSPDGRVAACTITSSSGSASLDAVTCDLLKRRGRFHPAFGDDGNFIEGSYSGSVTWEVPK